MKLENCPHCGGTSGYFRKFIMSYKQFYTATGEQDHYVDNNKGVRGGRLAYCAECGKEVKGLKEPFKSGETKHWTLK